MKIVFNGREYASIDAMPEAERRQYLEIVARVGDADGNGIPDIVENAGKPSVNVTIRRSITYNGRQVDDPGKLPPEARALLETESSEHDSRGFTMRADLRRASSDHPSTSLFRKPSGNGIPLGRILVTLAVLTLAAIAVLWLTGIRPRDLFGR